MRSQPDKANPLSRPEICKVILQSQLFQHWHWFRYHFGTVNCPELEHPLAKSIIDALLLCDAAMPGFAQQFIDSFAAIGGKEKFEPHYEQLLQRLAELHVVRQVVSFDWPSGTQFRSEPTAQGSKKNPEITVHEGKQIYGIEVKAPALLGHIRNRSANATQLPARVFSADTVTSIAGIGEKPTLPRDNPVKDFLISADDKFRSFKKQDPHFIGVLVIVWDDFIYEPISSLLHNHAGLLTPQTFYRDEAGTPITFPHVDGVFVIRHLHQLMRATRDEDLIDDCEHPLDFGIDGVFPFKAFIANPFGTPVPDILVRCLQGYPPRPEMGAEYIPKDLVWWM
jgi:hypothetical protein